MRSGVAFAMLLVSSSHLIESLRHAIPYHQPPHSRSNTRFVSHRNPDHSQLLLIVCSPLVTTSVLCRSLLIRVALVRSNPPMFIQRPLTDNACTSPFVSLQCTRASTYHTSSQSPSTCVLRRCLLRHDDGRQDHEAGLFSRTAAQTPWILLGTQASRSN